MNDSVNSDCATIAAGRAGSAAIDAPGAFLDPDLAAVIEAWPMLSAATKAGILAMIRTIR